MRVVNKQLTDVYALRMMKEYDMKRSLMKRKIMILLTKNEE